MKLTKDLVFLFTAGNIVISGIEYNVYSLDEKNYRIVEQINDCNTYRTTGEVQEMSKELYDSATDGFEGSEIWEIVRDFFHPDLGYCDELDCDND